MQGFTAFVEIIRNMICVEYHRISNIIQRSRRLFSFYLQSQIRLHCRWTHLDSCAHCLGRMQKPKFRCIADCSRVAFSRHSLLGQIGKCVVRPIVRTHSELEAASGFASLECWHTGMVESIAATFQISQNIQSMDQSITISFSKRRETRASSILAFQPSFLMNFWCKVFLDADIDIVLTCTKVIWRPGAPKALLVWVKQNQSTVMSLSLGLYLWSTMSSRVVWLRLT